MIGCLRQPATRAIYLGVGPKQRFVDFIVRTQAIPATEDEIYLPTTGQGWLAAFLIDEAGIPLLKSYVAATAIDAMRWVCEIMLRRYVTTLSEIQGFAFLPSHRRKLEAPPLRHASATFHHLGLLLT